jgi:hypothetical protein
LEQWEEDVVEAEEVRGMLLIILLDVTVVEKLGGAVVDFLHESFQEIVFIPSNMSGTIEFSEDVVNGFKEWWNLQIWYSFLR